MIGDPYYRGGGIHQIERGGKLDVHIDFNKHQKLNLDRRLNVIIYLNKNWDPSYGGNFEIWNGHQENGEHILESCKTKILPLFNRMACFNTSEKSYHGHPEPLNCPPDIFRRSLALYYYTAGDMGDQRAKEHSTIFINDKGKEEELGKITFFGRVKRKLAKILKNSP